MIYIVDNKRDNKRDNDGNNQRNNREIIGDTHLIN